jgi:hypothetical protein
MFAVSNDNLWVHERFNLLPHQVRNPASDWEIPVRNGFRAEPARWSQAHCLRTAERVFIGERTEGRHRILFLLDKKGTATFAFVSND